jgi:hypothetical protein
VDDRRFNDLERQRRRHGRSASRFPALVRLPNFADEALTVLVVAEADVRAMALVLQQDERSHEATHVIDEDFAVVYARRLHAGDLSVAGIASGHRRTNGSDVAPRNAEGARNRRLSAEP